MTTEAPLAGLEPLVAYARTSSAEMQSPEESLRWQLASSHTLIAGRGEIVALSHDRDISRSIPWARRPEARKLIDQLSNPNRGWTGIVVAEPQRAFGNASQFQTVIAQLSHYRATLWVPEVGGPVDPNSEVHDLIMLIFGGLSKAERNRLRTRVRTAVRAMAPEGRFLGGRPPYGFQIIRTETPHPNPEKARQGVQLTTLQVDPQTSETVRQIFQWRAGGLGYRSIASRLTDQTIPCPSAADRARNPHRHGRAWSVGAVRAIVLNPKYKGQGVFGRYHKVECLLDVNDPSAGNVTRLVPSPADQVIYTDDIVAPIVSEPLWEQAQPEKAPVTRGPRADRPSDPDRYAFRGLIVCEGCGRKMQGHMVKRRSGSERLGYRCTYRNDYPRDTGHQTSL